MSTRLPSLRHDPVLVNLFQRNAFVLKRNSRTVKAGNIVKIRGQSDPAVLLGIIGPRGNSRQVQVCYIYTAGSMVTRTTFPVLDLRSWQHVLSLPWKQGFVAPTSSQLLPASDIEAVYTHDGLLELISSYSYGLWVRPEPQHPGPNQYPQAFLFQSRAVPTLLL